MEAAGLPQPPEVDQRFADGSQYADANLMLAIPPGMLVIDQDDDDGGRAAIAALAAQFGELPPTLAHRTPHGEHQIYRTPPGWTGRAWVGKDARNPLPAGIDLRIPGQILMAAPSVVPGREGPAPTARSPERYRRRCPPPTWPPGPRRSRCRGPRQADAGPAGPGRPGRPLRADALTDIVADLAAPARRSQHRDLHRRPESRFRARRRPRHARRRASGSRLDRRGRRARAHGRRPAQRLRGQRR